MNDDERRQIQLSMLGTALARTDLTRGEIVVFTDRKLAISRPGVVLSESQENWILEVNRRPMPDLAKVEAVEVPKPWRPMTKHQVVGLVVAIVMSLVVFQFLLTFLLHWLGWR
jgi:hypothetical protein